MTLRQRLVNAYLALRGRPPRYVYKRKMPIMWTRTIGSKPHGGYVNDTFIFPDPYLELLQTPPDIPAAGEHGPL